MLLAVLRLVGSHRWKLSNIATASCIGTVKCISISKKHLSIQNETKKTVSRGSGITDTGIQKHNQAIESMFVKKVTSYLDEIRKYTSASKVIWVVFTVVIALSVAYVYAFPHEIRTIMANEVSTVASKSLEDDDLLNKAGQLSKEVLHNVLHDEQMKEQTAMFVTAILTTSETKDASVKLLMSVLKDPQIVDLVGVKLKAILLDIMQAEETRQVLLTQLSKLLDDDSTKLAVKKLVSDVTANPDVQTLFSEFFKEVLGSKLVVDQGNKLGRQITSSVISDKSVQRQAGDALWSTVKLSLTPSFIITKDVDKPAPRL